MRRFTNHCAKYSYDTKAKTKPRTTKYQEDQPENAGSAGQREAAAAGSAGQREAAAARRCAAGGRPGAAAGTGPAHTWL